MTVRKFITSEADTIAADSGDTDSACRPASPTPAGISSGRSTLSFLQGGSLMHLPCSIQHNLIFSCNWIYLPFGHTLTFEVGNSTYNLFPQKNLHVTDVQTCQWNPHWQDPRSPPAGQEPRLGMTGDSRYKARSDWCVPWSHFKPRNETTS